MVIDIEAEHLPSLSLVEWGLARDFSRAVCALAATKAFPLATGASPPNVHEGRLLGVLTDVRCRRSEITIDHRLGG
jgi:hypothetical protein